MAVARDGLSRNEAARRFGVAISTAVNWLRRHRDTGSAAPGKMGGHKPRKLIGKHRDWLLERAKTDFTLRGLRAELAERGIKVDYRTVWAFAHDEGLSFKKSVLPAEQLRPKVARRRRQWKKYQGRLDPRRLVFIDETWAKTNMPVLNLPKGHRCVAGHPRASGSTPKCLTVTGKR